MLVAMYALQESLPPLPTIVVAPPVEPTRLMSLLTDWEDFEDDEKDTPPRRVGNLEADASMRDALPAFFPF